MGPSARTPDVAPPSFFGLGAVEGSPPPRFAFIVLLGTGPPQQGSEVPAQRSSSQRPFSRASRTNRRSWLTVRPLTTSRSLARTAETSIHLARKRECAISRAPCSRRCHVRHLRRRFFAMRLVPPSFLAQPAGDEAHRRDARGSGGRRLGRGTQGTISTRDRRACARAARGVWRARYGARLGHGHQKYPRVKREYCPQRGTLSGVFF